VTRGVAVALVGWTALASGWFVFIYGGQVRNCLGPLNVTPEACRAALGLPPETGWERFLAGPGPLVVALVVGWVATVSVARWRRRQRGGL